MVATSVARDPLQLCDKRPCLPPKMFYIWNIPTLSTQQYCYCTGAMGIFVHLVKGIGFLAHIHVCALLLKVQSLSNFPTFGRL